MQVSSLPNVLQVNSNANATCGNGVVEGSNDEECDNGSDNGAGNACSGNCTLQGDFGNECSNGCPISSLGVCSSASGIQFCGNYDGDPCLELSGPLNCAGGTACTESYGDALCMPEMCSDDFQCSVSECVDGYKTRTCNLVSGGNPACSVYQPSSQIPCATVEDPTQIPFFGWVNGIVTLMLLAGIYGRRIIKKSKE